MSIHDLKPLLHLATLVAPALLVGHQRDVGVLGDALLAVTAVHAAAVLLVAEVVIAARQKGGGALRETDARGVKKKQPGQAHLCVNFR